MATPRRTSKKQLFQVQAFAADDTEHDDDHRQSQTIIDPTFDVEHASQA